MNLSDLDPAFVGRLENWGLYYRDRYRPGRSPIAVVCERLAAERGHQIGDSYAQSNPRPEIDVDDAMAIERHWCACAYRITAQHRALIRAYWVEPTDPRVVCRVLRIRFYSWESALCEAVEKFRQAVQVMECDTLQCEPISAKMEPTT